MHRNSRRISEAIKEVELAKGRDAEDHEVAEHLEMSVDEYHTHLKDSAGCRLFSFEDVMEKGEQGQEQLVGASPSPILGIERDAFKSCVGEGKITHY